MSCNCHALYNDHKEFNQANLKRLKKSNKEIESLLTKLDTLTNKFYRYSAKIKNNYNLDNCARYSNSSNNYRDDFCYQKCCDNPCNECKICDYDQYSSCSSDSSSEGEFFDQCAICEIRDITYHSKKYDCDFCRKCYDILQPKQVKKVSFEFEIPHKTDGDSKEPRKDLNTNLNEIWSLLTSNVEK